jgi:hypothetical protein
MDCASHDHRGQDSATAEPVVITTHWRLVGRSKRTLTCVTVRDTIGLELRAGYSHLALLRSQRVTSPETAATLAADWKVEAMKFGKFVDLDAPN